MRIILEGNAVDELVEAIIRAERDGAGTYRLRISADGSTVKFKINEGMWSPLYLQEQETER